MANFVTTNRSIHPQVVSDRTRPCQLSTSVADRILQVTINVETHETVDVDTMPKRDHEWPDMANSRSYAGKRSVSGGPRAYAV